MTQTSLWDKLVAWTIKVGEAILAPVERFIGKRSLVGDATFFPLERFPWVAHIEQNWTVIREEAEKLLEVQGDLANFQDISKDQIEITDDDRWKTFFLYGYGFEAKLGVEMCPRTAALMRRATLRASPQPAPSKTTSSSPSATGTLSLVPSISCKQCEWPLGLSSSCMCTVRTRKSLWR